MKTLDISIPAVALLACLGCTPIQPLVLSDAVGPLRMIGEPDSRGSLIVYSDTEGVTSDPADYLPHSNYRLHTMDGQLIRSVENRNGTISREPVTLKLVAGRYTVTARAPRVGFVTIPVVIETGSTTVVDLNYEVLPPSLAADERWVRLPNGQIVGSRSE